MSMTYTSLAKRNVSTNNRGIKEINRRIGVRCHT